MTTTRRTLFGMLVGLFGVKAKPIELVMRGPLGLVKIGLVSLDSSKPLTLDMAEQALVIFRENSYGHDR